MVLYFKNNYSFSLAFILSISNLIFTNANSIFDHDVDNCSNNSLLNLNLFYNDKTTDTWCLISDIIGWIYFTAWTVSFYGQVYENIKNKSVAGLSFDYKLYNLSGYSGYMIYTIWGKIDPTIGVSKIQIQDILFSIHALILTIVIIGQILYYYNPNDPKQKVSSFAITVSICIWWGFILLIVIENWLKLYNPHDNKGKSFAFNSIIYLGFIKAMLSLIKCLPQVLMNYKRKSTKGFSIFNIILDFIGGSFSFIQNLIDTKYKCHVIIQHDEKYLLNVVKYAISIITVVFDLVFLTQHYILYRNSTPITQNEEDATDENNSISLLSKRKTSGKCRNSVNRLII